VEKGLLNKQLENKKKKKKKKKEDFEEKALSQLEKANRTVKKVFKLDTTSKIRKDVIKEFFEKGKKNYTRIFDSISKFAADVDKYLSEFASALMPLKYTMKELRNWRSEGVRFKNLEDFDEGQDRRKRKKAAISDNNNFLP
jgi:uncharacterized protein (DUF4415 family)